VAQDWTNPAGNRGLSTFDQRNVLTGQLQYTTGMGLGGHTLMGGWKGLLYKEWTVLLNVSEGSGTPETPIAPIVLPGTSFSNVVRASYGTPANCSQLPGQFLNPCRYVTPGSAGIAPGFGDARRDSITGPSQFTLNGSMSRTFRVHDRYNVDARVDVTNLLNHVAYSSWNTTLGPLFGEAAGAGGMRQLSFTIRGRF
jgi:hypothetical protein